MNSKSTDKSIIFADLMIEFDINDDVYDLLEELFLKDTDSCIELIKTLEILGEWDDIEIISIINNCLKC
ncbi:hypothetical protein C0Z01_13505 [Photobacterium kishitanii]|nr:hypothetical protein AYY22_07835 [Photobacterium kishitanii]PSW68739.1 hypothetical protein C0Z01_13505 [Photobacterium kishitanii]